MLDLTNIRNVTSEMLLKAQAYTESFWQEIFNSLKVDESYVRDNSIEYPDEFNVDRTDPKDYFECLHFFVEYDCYGKLYVKFFHDTDTENVAFKLASNVLLANHFENEENEHVFVLTRLSEIKV